MKKKSSEKKEKGKEKQKKEIFSVLLRYLILLILGILLPFFYKIFLPLTLWPVYSLLQIFYDVSLSGNSLIIKGISIVLADACIAGSAYYLLLILNLTTKIDTKKRVCSIAFSFFSLLVLNILRIFSLSIILVQGFAFFDITHKIFWYLLSVLFVAGIWFLTCWIFKIKNIPVYSELKSITKSRK